MSPKKRPPWVQRNGDWIFQAYQSSFIFDSLTTKKNKVKFERSNQLKSITQYNLKVPWWWDGGIRIRGGPDILFRIEVKFKTPEFTSLEILGNRIYPTVNKDDLDEIALNLNRILTWSVREVATETSQIFIESNSVTTEKITEDEWLSLGKEISRLADRRKTTTEHLRNIARVYLMAKKSKFSTTRAIVEEFNYSPSRARALVALARKEGFLAPIHSSKNKGNKNEY